MTRSKETRHKRTASEKRKDYGYYTKRHGAHCVSNVFSRQQDAGSVTVSQSATIASGQSFVCDVATYTQIPYYSWMIYFSDQEYRDNSPTVSKIDALVEYFENCTSLSMLPCYIEAGFTIDIESLLNNVTLLQKWQNIGSDIIGNPHLTFDCIRAAFFEVMMRQSSLTFSAETSLKIFRNLRLIGINVMIPDCKSIKSTTNLELSSYGKLISIRGIVSKIGAEKLTSTTIVLACTCNREVIVTRQNGRNFVPKTCQVCGNGRFKRILDSPYEFKRFEQTIEIKDNDAANDETIEDGLVPSTKMIRVKLTNTLINRFVPGDRINVIGIPRVTLDAVKFRTPGLNPLYIDALSILPLAEDEILPNNIILDEDIIENIRLDPDVLELFVKSLCPTVQGHEIIKATLILGMVGGYFEAGEIRDYIHTLVISDMGFGKSNLLRACAQIHPKGAYVRGCSTTCLEPTVINLSNPEEPYWIGDGAFALASQGVCYIDELDKISSRHQSIYKCMENPRVEMTNTEIKLDIEARTGIVGIINPTKKRYDLSKTVPENVNANEELLTRFDMVFLMRDYADTNGDKLMCDETLELHTKRRRITKQRESSDDGSSSTDNSLAQAVASRTLLQRLATRNTRPELLTEKFLKMYIHYARTNIKPVIPNDSRTSIRLFCLNRYHEFTDSMSLERFVRTFSLLSQACAKIALRDQVREEDVYVSMEILSHVRFVKTKYPSANGPLAASGNSTKLTSNKVKQFLNDLIYEASTLGRKNFTTDELRTIAGKENLTGHILSTLISKLNDQGYLLKVSSNMYKLVSN